MTTGSEESFSVNFANGRRMDVDEVRRCGRAFMPDGQHAWVISVVYGIDNPEQALDTMELTDRNFVGVTAIRCLLCNEEYRTVNRFHKCPLPSRQG